MTKKVVQDIIPGGDSNKGQKPIDRSSFLSGYRSNKNRSDETIFEEKKLKNNYKNNRFKFRFIKWGSIILAIILVIIFSTPFYLSAVVTIEPSVQKLQLNYEFSAKRNSPDIEGLYFDVMKVVDESTSILVQSTGNKEVERKASGKIKIFNSYDSRPQKLIARTRFETPDGKVYRIDDPIVIPGVKKIDGKTVPGSIEAVVFADEPGGEYNTGLTIFTIPGFGGDPRFDFFHAESITEMTGGFIGNVKVVSDNDRLQAENNLKNEIEATLLQKASNQIPNNFVFFPNASIIDFTSIEVQDSGDKDKVKIQVTGSFEALIFNKDVLSHAVANEAGVSDRDDYIIHNIEDIGISFITDINDADNIEKIVFRVNGPVIFVSKIDEEAIVRNLLSQKKDSYVSIFSNYENIQKAEVRLRPTWWRSFPSDPNKIKINIVIK